MTPTPARIGAHSFIKQLVTGKATGSKIVERRGEFKPGEARMRADPLHIPSTISTSYGTRLAGPPRPLVIPSLPAAMLAFAQRLDREADALLALGRCEVAERLAHLALEARCRAAGERA